MRYIFLLLFSIIVSLAYSQDSLYQRLNSLQHSNTLPTDLLSSRTVVFVKVSPANKEPYIRGSWHKVAEKAQPGLKKAGIDAVVYYYIEDVLSGKESYHAFLNQLDQRDISNAVFLFEEANGYRMTVTALTDREHLIKRRQEAWITQGSNLETLLNNLYLAAANSGLQKSNLLIIETPQFGAMESPINKKRSEFYDLNFSSETLAIYPFADTSEIRRVMSKYPFKYDIVDPAIAEKDLRKNGYQYVLYYVNSIGRSVKEILGYDINTGESDYISEVVTDGKSSVKSININTPVYKFYIKHIYSGNVFLGKKWDADTTWQQGLDNYIVNLRDQLLKK